MKKSRYIAPFIMSIYACYAGAHDFTSDAVVTPLMSRALEKFPGQVGSMITVEYPPGGKTGQHRHEDAYTFVYVLEGRLEMQIKGGKLTPLGPGDTFFEKPGDIHAVSRNASNSEPARFLVISIKNSEAPGLTPVN